MRCAYGLIEIYFVNESLNAIAHWQFVIRENVVRQLNEQKIEIEK